MDGAGAVGWEGCLYICEEVNIRNLQFNILLICFVILHTKQFMKENNLCPYFSFPYRIPVCKKVKNIVMFPNEKYAGKQENHL